MIRYTITAIKNNGLRMLAFDNNHLNTYETEQQAQDVLQNVLKNNSEERILSTVGKDLTVMPVDCYSSGDAKGIYFAL